jgi:hypothetical protein
MASFILGILSWMALCGGMALEANRPIWEDFFSNRSFLVWAFAGFSVAGATSCCLAVAKIMQSRGRLSGLAPAGLGLALILSAFVVFALSGFHT